MRKRRGAGKKEQLLDGQTEEGGRSTGRRRNLMRPQAARRVKVTVKPLMRAWVVR